MQAPDRDPLSMVEGFLFGFAFGLVRPILLVTLGVCWLGWTAGTADLFFLACALFSICLEVAAHLDRGRS